MNAGFCRQNHVQLRVLCVLSGLNRLRSESSSSSSSMTKPVQTDWTQYTKAKMQAPASSLHLIYSSSSSWLSSIPIFKKSLSPLFVTFCRCVHCRYRHYCCCCCCCCCRLVSLFCFQQQGAHSLVERMHRLLDRFLYVPLMTNKTRTTLSHSHAYTYTMYVHTHTHKLQTHLTYFKSASASSTTTTSLQCARSQHARTLFAHKQTYIHISH